MSAAENPAGTTATETGKAAWRKRVAAMKNVPRLLRLVMSVSPGLVILGTVLRLASALVPISMLWVGKLIIDHVVARVTQGGTSDPARLWWLFGTELALACTSELLMRGIECVDQLLSLRFNDAVSLRIMSHACTLDLVTIEDPAFHDTMERAKGQIGTRLNALQGIGRVLQQGISFVSYAAGVLWFSWVLFGLLALSSVPVLVAETHFAALAYLLLIQQTPGRRELDYLRYLGASQGAAKEVRTYGLERYLIARYEGIARQFFAAQRRLTLRRTAASAGLAIVGLSSYYTAYGVVLFDTISGRLSVGDMTFLAGTFLRTRTALHMMITSFSGIADQALFLTNMFSFFDVRPRLTASRRALPAPRPIRRGFEFRGVSFQYPGSSRDVLRGVDLRIEPGECVALVGPNGAGKTTIVKLMARLYDPTDGAILLDGVDLRDYSEDDLRREIGIVFQDYLRYDMTAAENIGLGWVEDCANMARIRAAAERSGAADVIARLPRGYAQMLGRRFDGGADLSGGEWQKMAIGRAHMRDPQVLVLDEPTAALDARAEAKIFQSFADLRRDRMALLISHRFATVRMADRIIVLDGGEIREQGTHLQLLARAGTYAEMFHLQAEAYR